MPQRRPDGDDVIASQQECATCGEPLVPEDVIDFEDVCASCVRAMQAAQRPPRPGMPVWALVLQLVIMAAMAALLTWAWLAQL